jgi:hypothetical protein
MFSCAVKLCLGWDTKERAVAPLLTMAWVLELQEGTVAKVQGLMGRLKRPSARSVCWVCWRLHLRQQRCGTHDGDIDGRDSVSLTRSGSLTVALLYIQVRLEHTQKIVCVHFCRRSCSLAVLRAKWLWGLVNCQWCLVNLLFSFLLCAGPSWHSDIRDVWPPWYFNPTLQNWQFWDIEQNLASSIMINNQWSLNLMIYFHPLKENFSED